MDTPFSLPSAYRLASTRRWGRTQGLTVTPTGAARGRREFLCFRPGFYLSLGHVTHLEESREVYRSGDFIKLHFRLEGESRVGQPGSTGAETVSAMSVSTLLQPPGAAKEEFFASEVRERSVTLCCSRDFLSEELGLLELPPDGPFGAFMQARPDRFELLRFPLSTAQHGIADALLDDGSGDRFRGLYAEAKAFELLHGFLTRGFGDAPVDGTTAAARERLAPLKDHIDAHLGEVFDLRGLARRFGFSESGLARGFRQAHGSSLFEYVTKARLARARVLLEQGRQSVTEIALDVGYGHAANFSTAFKRHFGLSPQAARQAARSGRGGH